MGSQAIGDLGKRSAAAAAQSATEAADRATEAQQHRDAALTAVTGAETAETGAQAAQVAAETAKVAAETVALASATTTFGTIAAGLAATADQDYFSVLETRGVAMYRNDAGSETFHGMLSKAIYADKQAMADAGAGNGTYRVELVDGSEFEWWAGNRSWQVGKDHFRGVYVAPASDVSGASGVWRRIHSGTILTHWYGDVGTADDTVAVRAADEFLREMDEALTWAVSRTHTTRGFGDLLSKATYATKANADAALLAGDIVDFDIITVTADETNGGEKTRYDTRDGAFFGPLSNRGYNGKAIIGTGVAKRNGFKLLAGSPAWMRLFAASYSDAVFKRLFFNGDNPSAQWGGAQNNPDTELLVHVHGYGGTWEDNIVRFSGGDGVLFTGAVGNTVWQGGDCVSQYNIGYGVLVGRISNFTAAANLWVEGNDLGGVLLKQDIAPSTMPPTEFPKAISALMKNNIKLGQIYAENNVVAPVVTIQGGHYGVEIGGISVHGAESNRTLIHLKDNPDAEEPYIGVMGCEIHLGSHPAGQIICDAGSKYNVITRTGSLGTEWNSGFIDFRDAGEGNVVKWLVPDPCAFTPGRSETGDVSVNSGTSHIINQAYFQPGCSVEAGGLLGPVHDYNPQLATGPCFTRLSGFNPSDGGTEINTILSLNANLPGVVKTWYLIVLAEMEAHQQLRVGIKDETSGQYFNFGDRIWNGAHELGFYRVLRADQSHFAFSIPFEMDETARQIRPQFRAKGAGVAKLHHAWVTDVKHPALTSIRSGFARGLIDYPKTNDATKPPATAIPEGAEVWNVDQTRLERSTGAAWVTQGAWT